MKRLRTAIQLGLSGGLAVGVLAVSLPRFFDSAPPRLTRAVELDDAKPTLSTVKSSEDEQRPAIAHFLGIAQFLKHPTQYGLLCGLTCDDTNAAAKGEVVSASLQGDRLEIEYRYLTAGMVKTGQLIGKLNSDGIFQGSYRTDQKIGHKTAEHINKQTKSAGNITFTFAADGTAQGTYDRGIGDRGKGPAGIIL